MERRHAKHSLSGCTSKLSEKPRNQKPKIKDNPGYNVYVKTLLFCIIQLNSEKNLLPLVSVLLPSDPLHGITEINK